MYATFQDLPNPLYVAQGPDVYVKNDQVIGCGTCYKLTSTSSGISAYFLMVSNASTSAAPAVSAASSTIYSIGLEAMDYLNNHQSVQSESDSDPFTLAVTAEGDPLSDCNFSPLVYTQLVIPEPTGTP